MKRIKSFFCFVMLLALVVNMVICSPVVATAESITTVYVENIEAIAGKSISIPIMIKNNSGLAGLSLSFSYDSSLLTPVSVTYGEIIQSGLDDNLGGDAVPGSFKVIWYSSENLTANGNLINLNFKVDENATDGETSIGITYSQEDTFDENFNDVVLNCSSVNVRITGKALTTWYKSRLVSSDEKVTPGEGFDIMEEKLDVVGTSSMLKSVLKYNNDIFEFLGFAKAEPLEIKTVSADGIISLVNNNGTCYLEDNPEDVIGFVPDCYLFAARENAINSTGDFDLEIISNDYDRIETTGCSVRIENGTDYSIDIDNTLSASEGETLSVPVSISNNKGLMGYMIDFEYNPEQLEPVEVVRGSGFTGSFDDSIGSESGKFQVLWSDTQNNYTNGELFTVKFKVLTDSRVMSKIKVNYSQDDTFDENYNDVVLACNDFSVLLNECITHQYELVKTYPATCTEDGYEIYRCKKCGTDYTNIFEALGHDYQVTRIEPTCTENGSATYTCSRCDDIYTEDIPALGHSPAEPVRENEVKASCTHTGSYEEVVYCSVCQIELSREQKKADVLEHRFSSEPTAPTCTSKGYTTYTCKDCEYSYISDFTDMIEHHYTAIVHEPTTESQGYTVHVCTECGFAYVDNITEMIPGAIHYIVPSLNEIKASLTMKSDEAEYTITSSEGIFALSEVQSNTYRVYAKQKNSLTVCLGEYDTKQGEVVNNENVMLPLGDVNGDDVIDISDISVLLAQGIYGTDNEEYDLTGDSFISISDISVALQENCYGNHSVNII